MERQTEFQSWAVGQTLGPDGGIYPISQYVKKCPDFEAQTLPIAT